MHKEICLPSKYYKKLNEDIEEQILDDEDDESTSLSHELIKGKIFIDGEITKNDGMIFETIVETIKDTFKENDKFFNELQVHINSDGGDVVAGLNIISQIELLKKEGIKVITFVKEKAYSMAYLIAISGSYRIIRRYAKMLLHPSWFMLKGEIPLTITTMRQYIKDTNETWDIFSDIILSRTKLTKKQLDKIYKNGEDFIISSDKAVELGCIDKIL